MTRFTPVTVAIARGDCRDCDVRGIREELVEPRETRSPAGLAAVARSRCDRFAAHVQGVGLSRIDHK